MKLQNGGIESGIFCSSHTYSSEYAINRAHSFRSDYVFVHT